MDLFKEYTIDEMLRALRKISALLPIVDTRAIYGVFYDTLKLAYYRLERKRAGVKKSIPEIVTLKRKEITQLLIALDIYYHNDQEYNAEHELTQCFGPTFTEEDALKFFETYVEKEVQDKLGDKIVIDAEDGMKFLYKEPKTGKHEMKSEYYVAARGKRLPWITHTLRNTKNILQRVEGEYLTRVYLNKYNLELKYEEEKNVQNFWVVVVNKIEEG